MKPYPIPACAGTCSQGKHPCKTEALCSVDLHRYTPPITKDGGQTINFAERSQATFGPSQTFTFAARPMVEDKPSKWMYALIAGVALACLGVVALPFVMGAV